MGISLVTYAAQTVTPQDDALVYESALKESGMIYGGTVTIGSANVLHVAVGHGVLCGRKFTIEATDIAVSLTASGTDLGRLYIHMDLADTDEPISFKVETGASLTPVVQNSDVNINNGVYEINLATFDVDTSTISNLVNVAPTISSTPYSVDSALSDNSTNPVQNSILSTALGTVETIGSAASKAYSTGDLMLSSTGQLYTVTADIALGATITDNGNVQSTDGIVSQIGNNTSTRNYGTPIAVTTTSQTASADGIIRITYGAQASGYYYVLIDGITFYASKPSNFNYGVTFAYPIYKGMTYVCDTKSSSSIEAYYYPLV